MKQRKKRPLPPPGPMDAPPPMSAEDEMMEMPPMPSPLVDSSDPVYLERHALAQALQEQSALEGFVLLKNNGCLPLKNRRINVFGRHADLFFDPDRCQEHGVEVNRELYQVYHAFRTRDAGYTGSGWDRRTGQYVRQNRTSTGMFGGMGNLDHEPFIGYEVRNDDGSVRVEAMDPAILERAKEFSDTAVVVLYRQGGEGADHEKGDETLSEGECGMLACCTAHFPCTVVILACNSVIDGDFLVQDTTQEFYMYTYGGGVYSNNVGNEVLADFESRVELRYVDGDGQPAPHVYPIQAGRIGGVFYTCNKPGDRGPEALLKLLLGEASPSGRLMDEIVYDFDDNPASRLCGGLVLSRQTTGDHRYIYGHNFVAYKEGVYLGYKYFETFRPDRVAFPFGYGLTYTDFAYSDLRLDRAVYPADGTVRASFTLTNTGRRAGTEVVQVYVRDLVGSVTRPVKELKHFERVHLAAGESHSLTVEIPVADLAFWGLDGRKKVEPGDFQLWVAGDSASGEPVGFQVK